MNWRGAHRGTKTRAQVALVLTAAVGLAVTSLSGATAATARTQAHHSKPTVQVARTAIGPLLVNSSEHTIYMFVRDKHNKDVCRKIKRGRCEKKWPAVTTKGKPSLGPGVKKSLVGTIPYRGNLREVTYKGHPLHTYTGDTSKRDVLNIGIKDFGGAWYALNGNGGVVK
jgi:predicted lipoprotein with Yx(FWY)xxD motif